MVAGVVMAVSVFVRVGVRKSFRRRSGLVRRAVSSIKSSVVCCCVSPITMMSVK